MYNNAFVIACSIHAPCIDHYNDKDFSINDSTIEMAVRNFN